MPGDAAGKRSDDPGKRKDGKEQRRYYKLKQYRIPDLVQAFPMKDFKSKKFIPVSVTAIKNVPGAASPCSL